MSKRVCRGTNDPNFTTQLPTHTTHFDDCGCLYERYRILFNALKSIADCIRMIDGDVVDVARKALAKIEEK